ncbi:MAG: aromatic ring-hydroxylating dioxygenase subunit alpha [Acidimicrobiia bacterium]|nr:aromatic ring-hydroxylating dioxygenase subunit alpha [Acidimicrobiia bacterium]
MSTASWNPSDSSRSIPIPFGWFRVADSGDLNSGEVLTLRACGRELVVWRTDDGEAACADAFCPHLGAHLGTGGRVVGDSLVCPFHGWSFDTDGKNCDIPYSDRTNGRARLLTHPVVERNGFVLSWIHPQGLAPTFEVPELPEVLDPEFLPYIVSSYVVNTSVQEMGENAVDRCHFPSVHLNAVPPDIIEYDTTSEIARILSRLLLITPYGDFPGEIEIHQYGPGFSATRFRGFVDTLLVATQTPIEENLSELRFYFTVRKTGYGESSEEEARALALIYAGHIDEQAREDIPIWENKAYIESPALSDVDGPILEYRRWAKRFQVVKVK